MLVCTNLGQETRDAPWVFRQSGLGNLPLLQLAGRLCFLREQINFSFGSELFFLRLDLLRFPSWRNVVLIQETSARKVPLIMINTEYLQHFSCLQHVVKYILILEICIACSNFSSISLNEMLHDCALIKAHVILSVRFWSHILMLFHSRNS